MSIKHLEMGKIFLVRKNMMVEYLKDTGVNSNDLPKVKSEKNWSRINDSNGLETIE